MRFQHLLFTKGLTFFVGVLRALVLRRTLSIKLNYGQEYFLDGLHTGRNETRPDGFGPNPHHTDHMVLPQGPDSQF